MKKKSEKSSYGSPEDWATIISGAGAGASSAMQGQGAHAKSKSEAREAKRRTASNLLTGAMKRKQGLAQKGREHKGDLRDFQSDSLQHIARQFVESLKGSTG